MQIDPGGRFLVVTHFEECLPGVTTTGKHLEEGILRIRGHLGSTSHRPLSRASPNSKGNVGPYSRGTWGLILGECPPLGLYLTLDVSFMFLEFLETCP